MPAEKEEDIEEEEKEKSWWARQKLAKEEQAKLYREQLKRPGLYGEEERARRPGTKRLLIFSIIAVIIFFLQFAGVMPRLFPMMLFGFLGVEFILLGLAILAAVLTAMSGDSRLAAAAFFIIFIISWGSAYFGATPYGQQLSMQGQIEGIGAMQSFRSLAGPLNVMSQIFAGTYNPENLWRSDTIESQYETVTDVGVTLTNVKPLREKFYTKQPPVVQGRINAVAFPGQTAKVSLSASCTPALGSTKLECSSKDWPCAPQSFSDIKAIKNRYFSCTSPTLESAGIFSVDVAAKAEGTWTVAGKQFVFANPNVAITLENPLQTWGIQKESLKSWQKGDPFIDLGIGVAGVDEYGYLEAGSLNYYLGVSVANPASSSGTADFDSVQLFVPQALFGYNCASAGAPDFGACKNATTDDLSKLGLKTTAPLCDCRANIYAPLAPGTPHVNKLLSLVISESQLYGADFGTFFVLAAAKYNYESRQLVAVTVEEMTPS